MTSPFLPKSTAVWLIDNTSLTFEQIADFCHLHVLEIQGIADGNVAKGVIGTNPISHKLLSKEMIVECQDNPQKRLELLESSKDLIDSHQNDEGKKYVSMLQREDKNTSIAWLLKNLPTIEDAEVRELIPTTRATIEKVKKQMVQSPNLIKYKDPVLAGFCSQKHLNSIIAAVKERELQEQEAENENL